MQDLYILMLCPKQKDIRNNVNENLMNKNIKKEADFTYSQSIDMSNRKYILISNWSK